MFYKKISQKSYFLHIKSQSFCHIGKIWLTGSLQQNLKVYKEHLVWFKVIKKNIFVNRCNGTI